jgi:hypothetical protein
MRKVWTCISKAHDIYSYLLLSQTSFQNFSMYCHFKLQLQRYSMCFCWFHIFIYWHDSFIEKYYYVRHEVFMVTKSDKIFLGNHLCKFGWWCNVPCRLFHYIISFMSTNTTAGKHNLMHVKAQSKIMLHKQHKSILMTSFSWFAKDTAKTALISDRCIEWQCLYWMVMLSYTFLFTMGIIH